MRNVLLIIIMFFVAFTLVWNKLSIACCESITARWIQNTSEYVTTYASLYPGFHMDPCSPVCESVWSTSGSGLGNKYKHYSLVDSGDPIYHTDYPNISHVGTLISKEWKSGLFSYYCSTNSETSCNRFTVSQHFTTQNCP